MGNNTPHNCRCKCETCMTIDLYTGAQPTTLRPNTYLPAALADALCDALPEAVHTPIPGSGIYNINKDYVPALADLLLEVVAYTVASLLDAGSERDAVVENDTLRQALEEELNGWAE